MKLTSIVAAITLLAVGSVSADAFDNTTGRGDRATRKAAAISAIDQYPAAAVSSPSVTVLDAAALEEQVRFNRAHSSNH